MKNKSSKYKRGIGLALGGSAVFVLGIIFVLATLLPIYSLAGSNRPCGAATSCDKQLSTVQVKVDSAMWVMAGAALVSGASVIIMIAESAKHRSNRSSGSIEQ